MSEKKEQIEYISEKIKKDLEKIFELNKKNIHRKNDNLIKFISNPALIAEAYDKIQKNKGAHTQGTDSETADAVGRIRLNRISEEIANGTFEWRTIKRKLISKKGKKKSRPLGIVNFDDRVVQELIRIVLNTIYEPVFQEKEYNHGFRPKRGTRSAITKIERESQGMTTTIEGDIKSAYDNVNHKILMNFLKKKICDRKFLRLIKKGLEQEIILKNQKKVGMLGVPQGGTASSILFNIYMHEFDQMVEEKVGELLKKNNKEEGRVPMEKASTKKYKKLKSRIDSNRARIKRLIKKHQGLNEDNIDKYKELVLEKRQAKKKRLQVPFINRRKILLTFSYTRYADDWIILTNASEKHCEKIKKLLTDILKTEFKLELSNEKTKITNLEKEHASFLGFTLKNTPSKVQTRIKKDGTKFKARTTLGPRIGIDHERVMKRLEEVQVIKDRNEKKLKPRHVGIYCSLKDWEIVTKFNQILRGLFNYYYYSLTGKSDLHKYYYLYRYSCLKTLAHRLRISIAKITKKYGNELIMKYFIYFKDQNGKKIKKERSVKFPTYKKLMNETGFRVEREKKEQFAKLEKMKEGVNKKFLLNKIEFLDVFKSSYLLEDPFMEKDIRVNLRTGLKIFGYCALCGVMDTKKNPIVMHHVKHIKKGQIQGFKEIMRSLNIKKLPVCDECHRKIHRGEYDQKSLKDFESINQN
jgi:group II intron reverse transcriptase/maturase